MSDALIALGLIASLMLPFWWLKNRVWCWFTAWIGLVGVGGGELISLWLTGQTVSQVWWAWSLVHPMASTVMLGILGVAWTGLLAHLGCKLWKQRRQKR